MSTTLVVVPLSTVRAWQETFHERAPLLNVVCYVGTEESRDLARSIELGDSAVPRFNVLLTTFEFMIRDKQELSMFKRKTLVVDEAHRLKDEGAVL